MSPPVLEAKPPPLVQALCPRCSTTLPAYEGSAVLPCGACWPTMSPAERAPWLQALRRDPNLNMHRYRDPVLYAPPTLLAYVRHLEAQLAEREATIQAHLDEQYARDIAAIIEADRLDPLCPSCDVAAPVPDCGGLCAECHRLARLGNDL